MLCWSVQQDPAVDLDNELSLEIWTAEALGHDKNSNVCMKGYTKKSFIKTQNVYDLAQSAQLGVTKQLLPESTL